MATNSYECTAMYVAHGCQMIPLTRWSYALHAFNGMTTGDVYGTAVPYSTELTSQKKDLFKLIGTFLPFGA